MQNSVVHNLIDKGMLEGKRIFSTNTLYKRFLKPKGTFTLKPVGLWYSIGAEWIKWCLGEDFGVTGIYIYEIELNPKANILFLNKKKDVISFTEKYKKKDEIFSKLNSRFIDWTKVIADYDGIEINPYLHELRLAHGLIWYYGWDVASGCIWKASAKKKITLISKYRPRKKEFAIL